MTNIDSRGSSFVVPAPKLVRGLSLLDSVLLLTGGVIGSGIFLTPKNIAENLREPFLFLFIWIVGAAITLLACFAFAELGAMYPNAGGQYLYIRQAYGEFIAFVYGWMIFTVGITGTIAALAAGFTEYVGLLIPAIEINYPVAHIGRFALTFGHLISIASIGLLTSGNIVGLRRGAGLINLATWTKFAAIALFVLLGFMLGKGSWSHFSQSISSPAAGRASYSAIGLALIAVFWAYDGWVYVTWVAGEVKRPERNLPRTLVLGLGVVAAIYLAINVVYLYAIPMVQIAREQAVAQAAAVSMFSPNAGRALAAMIALSCFGAMASAILSGARVYYAMAEDRVFFRALAKVHARWKTPAMSLALQGVWSAALVLSGKYDELFTYVVFMMVLSYVITVAAVFVLRRKLPDAPRPYRCFGYPWVPALYILFGTLWALNAALERPKETLAGTVIVLIGTPFYFYWRRQNRIALRTLPSRPSS